MKRTLTIMISLIFLCGLATVPVFAGGDKVQQENGMETGPGSDAQGNQVNGD